MCRLTRRFDCLATFILPVAGILLIFGAVGEAANPKPSPAQEPVLEFQVEGPKSPVSLAEVNSRALAITFKIRNLSDREVVVWPFLELHLIAPDGKPLQRALNRGRFGASAGSLIESINFVTIAAGKAHEMKFNLRLFEYDLMTLTGWRIEERGTYTLKMQYVFDRKAAKKALGQGCKDLGNAQKPWNRAIEVKKTAALKLIVK